MAIVKSTKFDIGDKVFAKVRGFPHWPALIEEIDHSTKIPKYGVVFYGTKETAYVREPDIYSYLENKSRFGQLKSKNENLLKAIKEIDISFYKARVFKKSLIGSSSMIVGADSSLVSETDQQPTVVCSSPLATDLESSDNNNIFYMEANKQGNAKSDKKMSEFTYISQLLGPNWISDDVISPYLDTLNTKVSEPENVIIMDPTVSQAVKMLDDFDYILNPLNLENASHVFIPVSDSEQALTEGGSHWSLLAYERISSKFYHFDSLGHYNTKPAKLLAEKLFVYFNRSMQSETSESLNFVQFKCPQQKNSVDCGIFMIMTAETIIEKIINNKITHTLNDVTLQDFSELDVITKRSLISYVIMNRHSIGSQLMKSLLHRPVVDCTKTRLENCTLGSNQDWKTVTCKKTNQQAGSNFAMPLQNRFLPLLNNHVACASINTEAEKGSVNGKSQRHNIKNSLVKVVSKERSLNHQDTRPKLQLITDSQGRGIAHHLDNLLGDKLQVSGFVLPGAPLELILNKASTYMDKSGPLNEDYILLMGGGNNVFSYTKGRQAIKLTKCITLLEEKLKLFSSSNTILCTIPYRYDLHEESFENREIAEANHLIRRIAYHSHKVHLLDLHTLERCYQTTHGFHINRLGKKYVARQIKGIILESFSLRNNKQDGETSSFSQCPVRVVQDTMSNVRHRCRLESNIAFGCHSTQAQSIIQNVTTHTLSTATLSSVGLDRTRAFSAATLGTSELTTSSIINECDSEATSTLPTHQKNIVTVRSMDPD